MPEINHRVVIAVFPDVDLLDVTGPAEVFTLANREGGGRARYRVRLAGPGPAGEAVATSAGVRLVTDAGFADVDGAVDTLIVPGALEPYADGLRPRVDPHIVDWIRDLAPRTRRIASVCVGAHLLAAAGLLDGRTATTHWSTAGLLAAEHPRVTVDPDPIFVRSGKVWTGAGISACIDLALALVAEDHGEELALAVARHLVVYLKRQGGQSQFSVPISSPPTDRRDIDELRRYVADHLDADLSAAALAARMNLSERHFARVFTQETGATPAAYVESLRVEAARRLLETTDQPLEHIARATGLRSVETLHRAFRRRIATSPAAYRRRFRTTV
ncbi:MULTISPECIES: GlxA family transcriptional regulator [Streptomyces]|uniref:AraC family transcriptional regulator n=2 Tax=Streptomyces TaxID=1883 RepID=A0A2U9NVP8_STRAS|nr:helix-turn-helix domain-containing protein [Streptomyces actuosus]AWT41228.1 AraC family transcriptional regulator [Streptomyces actuosus]MBM4826240.1 DJ-1/PfpI family protein [Streptomyces actuosus]